MRKFLWLICLVLFSAVSFAGENLKLTEGLWHIVIPEKSGELKSALAAFRFAPDGVAELLIYDKMGGKWVTAREAYKKNYGKEVDLRCRWERKGRRVKIITEIAPGRPRPPKTDVYIQGENPDVLMPQDRGAFILLARQGAKLSPEQAKKFLSDLAEARRDKFADNLKLPKNVPLAEPEKELYNIHFLKGSHWRDAPAGSFQTVVVSAINRGPKLPDDAECRLPALEKLLATPEKKALLLQYLACHPEWRLYRALGKTLHATRYFRYPGGEIAPTQDQFYYHYLPTDPSGKKVGDPALEFQFRFDIALDGVAWDPSPQFARNRTEHRDNIWRTRFFCGEALLEICEISNFPGRQMTAAALDLTEKEFAALDAAGDNWRKLLPKDSFRIGTPDLVLRNGMQGGIYEAAVWCNPGEKGTIYLKAFEITKGTPLSAKTLEANSNCISGWSNDPREQYFSAMRFTIYEGELGQFYGARFELWFKPDAGGPERKLLEKNYKIQGWTR